MNLPDLFLILLFTISGALGSYFYKIGANKLPRLLKNWPLYLGVLAFILSNIFFILALRKNNLSIVYAFSGLMYVWTLFLGCFLGEKITLRKILAILLIIGGIIITNL